MSFLFSFIIKPLAYVSLPLFVLQRIAIHPKPSPLRYYARICFYVGTLFTVASCSFVVAVGMTILGRPYDTNEIVALMFYTAINKGLNLKIEVEGEEHLVKPSVYMSNHQSMIDVFVLGRLLSKKVVVMAKTSLQYTPLGPFMHLAGNIFIDRGNNSRAVRSVEAAGQKMKKAGLSLWIYPEGTRHMSEAPDMLPFKKGGFHLAINAGIPIIPIVVENYWRIYRKDVFDSGVIKIKILPPIPTDSLSIADVHDFSARVRKTMLEALVEISPKVSSEKSPTPEPIETEKDEAKQEPTPVESVESFSPPIVVVPSSAEAAPSSFSSTSSLASSSVSVSQRSGREDGADTEDEEIVFVGRPQK